MLHLCCLLHPAVYRAAEALAKTVQQQRDDLVQDVELAAQVQRMFLPVGKPAIAGLEIAGMMQPARGVSGDYYDYIPIDAHHHSDRHCRRSRKRRIGELLALRWGNVDLERRLLRVAETVYDGHFDKPKTKRSARTIPIGAETVEILTALGPGQADPRSLIFATRDGLPLDRWNLLRKHVKAVARRLGMPGATWHSLRHCHATMLEVAGTPLV